MIICINFGFGFKFEEVCFIVLEENGEEIMV